MMAGLKPRFLASVRNVAEAELATELGAEVIDLKEPRYGALGAVPEAEQRRVLAALGVPRPGSRPGPRPMISATVGDLPFEAEILAEAIRQTEATGVDFVKFGVYASGDAARSGFAELDRRLRDTPRRANLVALLLADRMADIDEAITLACEALMVRGIIGVMIDTAAKGTDGAPLRALPDIFAARDLSRFVAAVHANGGFAGLAGCLCHEHIVPLVSTGADVLGFRGALCSGSRNDALSARCFLNIRDHLVAARAEISLALCPA